MTMWCVIWYDMAWPESRQTPGYWLRYLKKIVPRVEWAHNTPRRQFARYECWNLLTHCSVAFRRREIPSFCFVLCFKVIKVMKNGTKTNKYLRRIKNDANELARAKARTAKRRVKSPTNSHLLFFVWGKRELFFCLMLIILIIFCVFLLLPLFRARSPLLVSFRHKHFLSFFFLLHEPSLAGGDEFILFRRKQFEEFLSSKTWMAQQWEEEN